VYNRTRFRNYFDLAYRLLRAYERTGRTKELRALVRRMATGGGQPFGEWWKLDPAQDAYRDHNKLTEDLNACLSLAVELADENLLAELGKLWADRPDFPAKRQLARRRKGLSTAPAAPAVPWADVPENVRLLAGTENVLCLARDNSYVYAGHPWGVAVLGPDCRRVVHVPLGLAALCLETTDGFVWAGTPKGLVRIEVGTWRTGLMPLNGDLPAHDRKPDDHHQNGVVSLAADDGCLWIGTHRLVQRLNLKNNELRVFSHRELGSENNNDWERFLPEKRYVWAQSDEGAARFDRRTETWTRVMYRDKPVDLLDIVDGQLFGNVRLPEPLRCRPCLIDRGTLAVTPIMIAAVGNTERCWNGPFSYFGKWQDKLLFGDGYPQFVYASERRELSPFSAGTRPLRDLLHDVVPAGLRSGDLRRARDGSVTCYDDQTHRHTVYGKRFHTGKWSLLPLPDGSLLLGGRYHWKRLIPLFHRYGTRIGALHSTLNESINGIKVVKAFAQEHQRRETFDDDSEALSGTVYAIERTWLGFSEGMFFVMSLGVAAVWCVAAYRIARGDPNLTLGTLLAFAGYIWMFYDPLSWFTRVLNWMTHAFSGAERIFALLDSPPEIYEAPDAVSLPVIRGEIAFHDVRFSYERGKEVIRGIDLHVGAGEMIGLVGKSGAGKSTIINLVCRFYDPDDGEITVDGYPINRIELEQLRRSIGIVMQEPFLFAATILDNIRCARPQATFAEVVRAAKAAHAHDFIVAKEDGYDTVIGEGGMDLSGGERQRLSIARAILHDPPILILDEATSSVDSETEKAIQQAIANLTKNRTTIAIAHRLATLRNAHRLMVVDDGRIVESGSHDELLDADGVYAKLVKMQTELSRLRGNIWEE